MNTEKKYIEWDLNKFKAGWPAEWQGFQAKFVAYANDADTDSSVVFLVKGRIRYACENGNAHGRPISLIARELDPHPDNKDGLFKDKIGDGWRIKGHNEPPNEGDEVWCGMHWDKRKLPNLANHCTYRTRDPLPATKVPLGPEDIILGKTVVRAIGSGIRNEYLVTHRNQDGVSFGGCLNYWPDLRTNCEISFDNGTTWQKPEKEGKS